MRAVKLQLTVVVLSAVSGGCSSTDTELPPIPETIEIIFGHSQPGTVGEDLPLPLLVRVRDTEGDGYGDADVSFSVTSRRGVLDDLWEDCSSSLGVGDPARGQPPPIRRHFAVPPVNSPCSSGTGVGSPSRDSAWISRCSCVRSRLPRDAVGRPRRVLRARARNGFPAPSQRSGDGEVRMPAVASERVQARLEATETTHLKSIRVLCYAIYIRLCLI